MKKIIPIRQIASVLVCCIALCAAGACKQQNPTPEKPQEESELPKANPTIEELLQFFADQTEADRKDFSYDEKRDMVIYKGVDQMNKDGLLLMYRNILKERRLQRERR